MLQRILAESWRKEMKAAHLYKQAANLEENASRRAVLLQLAQIELTHAALWEQKLQAVGEMPVAIDEDKVMKKMSKTEIIQQLDEIEQQNEGWYEFLRLVLHERDMMQIIEQIDHEESNHKNTIHTLYRVTDQHINEILEKRWDSERWHKQKSVGWLGDAIYGVNDGLGAIFGIIAGVAGYTSNSHAVLVSGFFGAVASTLSMGVGAWLATRSKNELALSEHEQERREIMENPEEEKEELQLLYQLKGFTQGEAAEIVDRLSRDPEQLLKAMNYAELGISVDASGNPWTSAAIGSLSTLVGGLLPLIPFFFLNGIMAIVGAAVVSVIAHFVVGAAKSMVTVRRWWTSGLEMTFAGILVGIVSYVVGLIGTTLIHV